MNIGNKISISEEQNITYIDIEDNALFDDLMLAKRKYKNYFFLSLDNIILKDNEKLDRQKIFIVNKPYDKKIITLNHYYIVILVRSKKENINIIIDRENNNYIITRSDNSTLITRKYCSNGLDNSLLKKDALFLANNILDDLNQYSLIKNYMYWYDPYESLSIVPNSHFHPIISNDLICLSWTFKKEEDYIDEKDRESLDIILNDTRERVGDISFAFINNEVDGFTYDGNISYDIKECFRNKGYATQALNLLKEILKNNNFNKSRNLFISTLPENTFSQRVALSNGFRLFYSGSVPEYDMLNFSEGVKNVVVYQLKI